MKMRTRLTIAAASAAALALAAATPASAAVTYKATAAPAITQLPAIDTGNNTIYSAITKQVGGLSSSIYSTSIVAVDATTLKTKSTYLMAQYDTSEGPVGLNVTDLRVNSKTHTVWAATVGGEGDSGAIWEINGTTMKLVRIVEAADYGYAPGQIAVNPTTNSVFVAWAWYDWVDGSPSDTPLLESINGSTGATATVALPNGPSDGDGLWPYGYPGNVAFDSANNGVYVAQGGHEYAYASSTLKLASSVAFPASETLSAPKITADGTTHTIYAVGAKTIYSIAGSTNKISRSTTATAGNPVVDPTIKTVYVGTQAFSESTLAKTGTLPKSAVSVNGSTHTIYSPGYVTTRNGN